jgi:hypothetical protein
MEKMHDVPLFIPGVKPLILEWAADFYDTVLSRSYRGCSKMRQWGNISRNIFIGSGALVWSELIILTYPRLAGATGLSSREHIRQVRAYIFSAIVVSILGSLEVMSLITSEVASLVDYRKSQTGCYTTVSKD